MKRFVFIIRGPVAGISSEFSLASELELDQIRTWLKGLKSTYADMLFQKFSGELKVLNQSGKIDHRLIQQIEGGEISQIVTLILPSLEVAEEIAASFPYPNEFYSLELREMA
ncbi:MAG: hypothetical protein NTX34_08330 [Cytophagales bacterium]|jgi:hypothetical protein|nr:hypothetical protein [Cytophagales bacterium]